MKEVIEQNIIKYITLPQIYDDSTLKTKKICHFTIPI